MEETVSIALGDTVLVFDTNVKYVGDRWTDGVLYRKVCIYPPWLEGGHVCEYLDVGDVVSSTDPDNSENWVRVTLQSGSSATIQVLVERSEPPVIPEPYISDVRLPVRVDMNYYLAGKINDIDKSHEMCCVFRYPGETIYHNLPGDIGIEGYTYFKDTEGLYRFEDHGRYIPVKAYGDYQLCLIDVEDNCENVISERSCVTVNIPPPVPSDAVFFDPEDPHLAGSDLIATRRWDAYAEAEEWKEQHEYGLRQIEVRRKVAGEWHQNHLCYLCWNGYYYRGMCDCIDFSKRGWRHKRPCVHLIHAYLYFGDDVLSCPDKIGV